MKFLACKEGSFQARFKEPIGNFLGAPVGQHAPDYACYFMESPKNVS